MKIIILSLFSLFISCNKLSKEKDIDNSSMLNYPEIVWSISSTNNWLENDGLVNVESVIYDELNKVFYVTNGLKYEEGTNGFISKISENGKLLQLKWVKDLNRPTGMAIKDSLLYVADFNTIVVIDTKRGKTIEKFTEPVANSGLNDVSINKKGDVYVSASAVHSIFKLNNEKLELWSENEEKLKWANGLIANDKQVLVAGLNLSIISVDSNKIDKVELNSLVKDFEGIVADGFGGYFLTTVENSGLYYLNEHNVISKLLEEDIYFGDLEFIQSREKIYIPRGNRKTGEFFITVFTMEKSQQIIN